MWSESLQRHFWNINSTTRFKTEWTNNADIGYKGLVLAVWSFNKNMRLHIKISPQEWHQIGLLSLNLEYHRDIRKSTKNTTLWEQVQSPIGKSYKEVNSIPIKKFNKINCMNTNGCAYLMIMYGPWANKRMCIFDDNVPTLGYIVTLLHMFIPRV